MLSLGKLNMTNEEEVPSEMSQIEVSNWEQTEKDLIVRLNVGKKLKPEDVSVDFTRNTVTVNLSDGRIWEVVFHKHIKPEASRFKRSKQKLVLLVTKEHEGPPWPYIHADKGVTAITEKAINPLTGEKHATKRRMDQFNKSSYDVHPPKVHIKTGLHNVTETIKPPVTSKSPDLVNTLPVREPDCSPGSPKIDLDTDVHSVQESPTGNTSLNMETDIGGERSDDNIAVEAENRQMELEESMEIVGEDRSDGLLKSETSASTSQPLVMNGNQEIEEQTADVKQEQVYNLTHLKNDWYEMANQDTMSVQLYVKQVKHDSVDIEFNEQSLVIKLKTSDAKFLSLYEGTSENTLFTWNVLLMDRLKTTECTYSVNKSTIDLRLKKQVARRWGAFEALNMDARNKSRISNQHEARTSPHATEVDSIQSVMATDDRPEVDSIQSVMATDDRPEVDSQPTKKTVHSTKINLEEKKAKNLSQPDGGMFSSEKFGLVKPGMTGLDNIGNNCFLNSVVQILSNTIELRDFCLGVELQNEINPDNHFGTGGRLAVAFSVLLRTLWSGQHYSANASKLKNLVAKKASQFAGYDQHDAQEFMIYLLDLLHEDLNRVKEKPYTQEVEPGGRADDVVAAEVWKMHKMRDDSVIVDLFKGQFKSTITCPTCNRVSHAFDPFMILSVPIPKKKRSIDIIFLSNDPSVKPRQYAIPVREDGTASQLNEQVSKKTGRLPSNLRIFESYRGKFQTFFKQGKSLTGVNSNDDIFVAEVLSEEKAREAVLEIGIIQRVEVPLTVPDKCSSCRQQCQPNNKLKRCTRCYKTAYCDRECQKNHWSTHRGVCSRTPECVGHPFIISLPRSQATLTNLRHQAEMFSRYSVDVHTDGSDKARDDEEMQKSSSDRRFSFIPCTKDGITLAGCKSLEDCGVEELDTKFEFLAMQWKNGENRKPRSVVVLKDFEFEEETRVASDYLSESRTLTLEQCLDVFMEPEVLCPEQAWYCSACKEHKQATKQMSIWRLPETLVIQIKRFSHVNILYRQKMSEHIKFPVRGLDLSDYLIGCTEASGVQPVYDLYGVINHYGHLSFGHYTAFARCPDKNDETRNVMGWRSFDDRNVTRISEKELVTENAYLLFYRRRQGALQGVTTERSSHVTQDSQSKVVLEKQLPYCEDLDLLDDLESDPDQITSGVGMPSETIDNDDLMGKSFTRNNPFLGVNGGSGISGTGEMTDFDLCDMRETFGGGDSPIESGMTGLSDTERLWGEEPQDATAANDASVTFNRVKRSEECYSENAALYSNITNQVTNSRNPNGVGIDKRGIDSAISSDEQPVGDVTDVCDKLPSEWNELGGRKDPHKSQAPFCVEADPALDLPATDILGEMDHGLIGNTSAPYAEDLDSKSNTAQVIDNDMESDHYAVQEGGQTIDFEMSQPLTNGMHNLAFDNPDIKGSSECSVFAISSGKIMDGRGEECRAFETGLHYNADEALFKGCYDEQNGLQYTTITEPNMDQNQLYNDAADKLWCRNGYDAQSDAFQNSNCSDMEAQRLTKTTDSMSKCQISQRGLETSGSPVCDSRNSRESSDSDSASFYTLDGSSPVADYIQDGDCCHGDADLMDSRLLNSVKESLDPSGSCYGDATEWCAARTVFDDYRHKMTSGKPSPNLHTTDFDSID